ncbi:MAG TPA: S8 family serine peptidase, partial [Terriglobales bacterium]|nr:S8 family serine peptidase [Terriglobales bacterium]
MDSKYTGRRLWWPALTNVVAILTAAALMCLAAGPVRAETAQTKRYIVVFTASQAADGTFVLGGNYALNYQAALSLVKSAGGTVGIDLSRQIATMVVDSANPGFAQILRASSLVEEVGEDFKWKAFATLQEIQAGGATPFSHPGGGGGGPEQTTDPLESMQWSMMQIQAPEAHAIQAGWRAVDVGILDSGVDGHHLDFDDDGVAGGATNVDCARGNDFVPVGPGVGNPDPCTDNGFHGTHVAGI